MYNSNTVPLRVSLDSSKSPNAKCTLPPTALIGSACMYSIVQNKNPPIDAHGLRCSCIPEHQPMSGRCRPGVFNNFILRVLSVSGVSNYCTVTHPSSRTSSVVLGLTPLLVPTPDSARPRGPYPGGYPHAANAFTGPHARSSRAGRPICPRTPLSSPRRFTRPAPPLPPPPPRPSRGAWRLPPPPFNLDRATPFHKRPAWARLRGPVALPLLSRPESLSAAAEVTRRRGHDGFRCGSTRRCHGGGRCSSQRRHRGGGC